MTHEAPIAAPALRMNSESQAGQMLCPHTAYDISLVVGIAGKVVLLSANANFFPKPERQLPAGWEFLLFFHFSSCEHQFVYACFLKTTVRTSRTGTERHSIFHAGQGDQKSSRHASTEIAPC